MAVDTDDEFQKELIALFVQEAQEWLQQIHVALDELQQGPPAERHLKLAHTIKAGLTNLGGSAATIGLHEIEKSSFIGLPLVEAVENPSAPPSATAFLALCRQLGQIHDALTRATGVTFDAEVAPAEVIPVTVPTQNLLMALHELLSRLAGHAAMPCRVTKTIIAQIEGMTRNGVTHCDAAVLRDVLERGAQADQAFAQAVRQLGPLVAEGIHKIARGSVEQSREIAGEWKAMADHAGELLAASQQVNAVEAMTFFAGLQSFVAIVIAQRVVPASVQFERVASGLRGVLAIIHEWAEAGQRERQAIEALLPAA
jgi:HPt (histidine-containing phosphotransfer) domain-containing protein